MQHDPASAPVPVLEPPRTAKPPAAICREASVTWQSEQGGVKPWIIHTITGDYGGKTYGIGLTLKSGSLAAFVRSEHATGLRRHTAGASLGSREFDAAWRKWGLENPCESAAAQVRFVSERFYEPNVRKLKEHTGIDIERMEGFREMLLSQSTQRGALAGSNALRAFNNLRERGADPKSQNFENAWIAEFGKVSAEQWRRQFRSSSRKIAYNAGYLRPLREAKQAASLARDASRHQAI